ncbi:MAG: rhomboid family intramembrane serine protease [Bacteroidia bacterium]|jgi:membrane associated rhomboid family serine protease|nr:rhomboid family intramembrane serine protease [Bacteroidia bacterium]
MDLLSEINFKFKQGNAIIKIILINIVVYLAFALIGLVLFLFNLNNWQTSALKLLMLPASVTNFVMQPWSLVTYMFLHEGFFHLLFNMLWLYWLGNLFQQYLGNSKSYQAYILGGFFGGIIYMLSFNLFPAFSNQVQFSYALGASAGVLSIVIATATLLPNYQVYLLILGPVKLKYIALVSVLLDLISIPNGNAGGHIAHIGGAVFGYFFIKLIYSNNLFSNQMDRFFESFGKVFKSKPPVKVYHKGNNAKPESFVKQNQQQIDQILDKISKNGYESLSQREKEILFKASKD